MNTFGPDTEIQEAILIDIEISILADCSPDGKVLSIAYKEINPRCMSSSLLPDRCRKENNSRMLTFEMPDRPPL